MVDYYKEKLKTVKEMYTLKSEKVKELKQDNREMAKSIAELKLRLRMAVISKVSDKDRIVDLGKEKPVVL